MAKGTDWTASIMLGLALGGGYAVYRLLKKTGSKVKDATGKAREGAQKVADKLLDVSGKQRIVAETNVVMKDIAKKLKTTADPAKNLHLQIERLQAVKDEALALGNTWALEHLLQRKLSALHDLEGS